MRRCNFTVVVGLVGDRTCARIVKDCGKPAVVRTDVRWHTRAVLCDYHYESVTTGSGFFALASTIARGAMQHEFDAHENSAVRHDEDRYADDRSSRRK